MTLAFQSLLMIVVLVTGTVSILPVLLRVPDPHPSPALRSILQPQRMWLVESPRGQWFVNGGAASRRSLAQLVRSRRGGHSVVHYLPSDALPLERVAASLRWLRSLAPGSVVLELPPATRPMP